MTKNIRPIVLNCFTRGGSNILWNIFLSHPEVCSPIKETAQIFSLDRHALRTEGLLAAWLTHQWHFFDPWNLRPRNPISSRAQRFIDERLFRWKLRTLDDPELRYRSRDALYSRAEVESARLVLKNNDGIVFLSEHFLELYPDGVFFALVRDPIPLYEGHKRNRTPWGGSPETFSAFYISMVRQMQADAARWSCYHILRFEDMVRDPMATIQKAYALAGLDPTNTSELRLKAKPYMHADGSHTVGLKAGKHHWLPAKEISQLLEPNVNEFQNSRLDAQEMDRIQSLTASVRATLGSPTNAE